MVDSINNAQVARQTQVSVRTSARVEKKNVNIDELIQAALRGKPQAKELTTKEKFELVMKEFDTNKDGNISETEAEEGLKRLGAEQKNEEAQETDKKEPTAYTVQNGEGFKSLIKRSLQGQGIENPTEEQMEEAIKAFKENPKNKGTFKTNSKGVTYLLVGKKVYIPGGLEDKNNADEQIMAYTKAMSAKHEAKVAAKISLNAKTEETKNKVFKPVVFEKSRYHKGFVIVQVNDDGSFYEKDSKNLSVLLVCDKNGSVSNKYIRTKDGNYIETKYEKGKVLYSKKYTKDGKSVIKTTYYDEKGKADYTFTYDKKGNVTLRRNHKYGDTVSWATVNNTKIAIKKYDNGKIEYYKNAPGKTDDYSVLCDKYGITLKK